MTRNKYRHNVHIQPLNDRDRKRIALESDGKFLKKIKISIRPVFSLVANLQKKQVLMKKPGTRQVIKQLIKNISPDDKYSF